MHRLARLREAVAGERLPPLGIVLEREGGARRGLGENLLQQVEVVRMDVVLEPVQAVLLQPGPRHGPPAIDPEADLPFVLATLVLAEAPRDVTDVHGRARPAQPPLLECQLLHRGDDRSAQSHR